VNESVWLGYRVDGAALPGRKVMSLVHGMLAGADSIDDMDLLRVGLTGLILGHRVMAPSTLGTFLRAFTFGHVRQLDRVLDVAPSRAWGGGRGPGRAAASDRHRLVKSVCQGQRAGNRSVQIRAVRISRPGTRRRWRRRAWEVWTGWAGSPISVVQRPRLWATAAITVQALLA